MPHAHRVGATQVTGMAIACIVALATTAAGASAQTAERYTLRGERVAIYNLVGSIRLEGAAEAGGATIVEVTKRGNDGSKLKVETGALRGKESLRVIYPERRITFGTGRSGFGRCSIEQKSTYVTTARLATPTATAVGRIAIATRSLRGAVGSRGTRMSSCVSLPVAR